MQTPHLPSSPVPCSCKATAKGPTLASTNAPTLAALPGQTELEQRTKMSRKHATEASNCIFRGLRAFAHVTSNEPTLKEAFLRTPLAVAVGCGASYSKARYRTTNRIPGHPTIVFGGGCLTGSAMTALGPGRSEQMIQIWGGVRQLGNRPP